MSEEEGQGKQGTVGSAGGPSTRPAHRRGRQPVGLYVGVLVVLLLVVGGILWASGVLGGLLRGAGPGTRVATPTSTPSAPSTSAPSTPTPSAPATSAPATEAPFPASVLAESEAAIKAAALPYPDPPSVAPETIRSTHPSRKLVAITLDDGIPFDTRILDLLEQRNVRLTTFLLGQAVKAHPDLIERLNKDGFEIANHTWDHKNLTKLTDGQIRTELRNAQDRISSITGDQAPYMRPPGGATNGRVRRIAASMGYRVVLWNKSFADTSAAASPDRIFHRIMDDLQPGDIILCHWGGKNTYEGLKLILPAMEERGFIPVTLSELLKYSSTAAGTAAVEGGGGAGTPSPAKGAAAGAGAGGAARTSTSGAAGGPGMGAAFVK